VDTLEQLPAPRRITDGIGVGKFFQRWLTGAFWVGNWDGRRLASRRSRLDSVTPAAIPVEVAGFVQGDETIPVSVYIVEDCGLRVFVGGQFAVVVLVGSPECFLDANASSTNSSTRRRR
jgi:hypothetical protein